ncbi:MAG: J domain-containing protein [Candidatus Dormibacteraceae bacterium]
MSPAATENPHLVLGLAPTAEPEVVQGAYKALALKYHPDRNASGCQRMKAINAAYEAINDPRCRREWQSREQSREQAGRKEQTSSWTAPPSSSENSSSLRCRHHPYCQEQGRCSSCGAAMCKLCRGWKRSLTFKPICLDCRAGQLEAQLAALLGTLVGGSLAWGLISHGHFGSGLLLSYPIAALPTGLRLWNRVMASAHGRRLSARLKNLNLTPQQQWLLKIIRWLLPLLTGMLLCPMGLVVTASLLALEIHRGGYGISWWRALPERLRLRLAIWQRSFA